MRKLLQLTSPSGESGGEDRAREAARWNLLDMTYCFSLRSNPAPNGEYGTISEYEEPEPDGLSEYATELKSYGAICHPAMDTSAEPGTCALEPAPLADTAGSEASVSWCASADVLRQVNFLKSQH